jgi:ribulose-5-phosphate 4-epimerase/fuculose-1-phosphate aldolase
MELGTSSSFYGSHSVFAEYTGVVLDVEEGDRIADALGAGKAVILRNHGLLTVGTSVEEAAWLFVAMEQACHVQVMAEAIGTPLQIEPSAALTESQVGSAIGSKAQFDMQWEALVVTVVSSSGVMRRVFALVGCRGGRGGAGRR